MYPKKDDIKHCPEIKKRVEKPPLDHSVAKEKVQAYIQNWVKGQENTTVVNVKRDNATFTILTTSNFCETTNSKHDDVNMTYVIKKNQITQKCPVCKRNKSRAYALTPDVLKVLKQ